MKRTEGERSERKRRSEGTECHLHLYPAGETGIRATDVVEALIVVDHLEIEMIVGEETILGLLPHPRVTVPPHVHLLPLLAFVDDLSLVRHLHDLALHTVAQALSSLLLVVNVVFLARPLLTFPVLVISKETGDVRRHLEHVVEGLPQVLGPDPHPDPGPPCKLTEKDVKGQTLPLHLLEANEGLVVLGLLQVIRLCLSAADLAAAVETRG